MIVSTPEVSATEFERRTGWVIKPEGACKGDRCVPLTDTSADKFSLEELASKLRMPVVHDSAHGLWAIGPESDAPPLLSAEVPQFTLPDRNGEEFSLDSLRGQKVFLLAWASW